MYVLNPKKENIVSFMLLVENHLIKNGIPVYATVDGKRQFRKSKILDKVLREAPILIRFLAKEGR